MNLPEKCCSFGEFKCDVPMPIASRMRCIDYCIADIVAALNAANITTSASCCGHSVIDGNIMLEDGRVLTIQNVKKK